MLDGAHLVLPLAMWAEVEGTFTNYQRRVQRIKVAVPPPGDARPGRELLGGVLQRLGIDFPASAREVFARLAASVPGYEALGYPVLGFTGRALPLDADAGAAAEGAGA